MPRLNSSVLVSSAQRNGNSICLSIYLGKFFYINTSEVNVIVGAKHFEHY